MNSQKNRLGYFFEIALVLVIFFVVIIPPPSYYDLTRCGCVQCLSISNIFFKIKSHYHRELNTYNSNKIEYLRVRIDEILTY